jgi:signal transduction histidine kinase
MKFRFRLWMPIVAVLLVLLSIGTLLLYVLPTAKARLGEYVENRTLTQAAVAASAIAQAGENAQSELDLAARTGGGQVLIVDKGGKVVDSAGPDLLSRPPQDILSAAASGRRLNEQVEGRRVGVVPLVRDGNLEGGLVFVAGDSETSVYEILLRSGAEAAVVASILGGGLALLLATLLSRRVERLTAGARSIEEGDLSYRIRPGFGDELGDLARSFNSMAGKLEASFLQLKEKGATLNAILNNLSEGVLATDLKGRVVFINLSARSILGIGSEGPLDELPSPWADFDLPEAVDRCARWQQCGEARVSDGKNFLQVKLEHLPEFDDHKGGVLVVFQDLSEGRRLEANQQRFLANAAHELKTPITTILGAAELLLTEEDDDPEIRHRFLKHISAEAQRMHRLSDTLLRLARTGADLREPDIVLVDLDGIARETAERMEALAESAGLTLRVEGRGGRVGADREWLEQCLLILLQNAVQHSGRGGEVVIRLDGRRVAVEDRGVGIKEEDLPYIFERFYRSKSDSDGFGLGLPICRELVERMGGRIALHSEEGVGTRVEIELPEEA